MGYDDIVSELTAIREALETGNRDQLDRALDQLHAEYDAVKMDERSRVARLQTVRVESDLTSRQHDIIGVYERWFMTTYFGRGGLLTASDLYLLDPDAGNTDELRDQTAELTDRENRLQDATGRTIDVLRDVEIPPRLGILSLSTIGISPSLGNEIQVKLLLANVGDEPATGVEVVLTSDGFEAEQSTIVGPIESRKRQMIAFDVAASTGGRVSLSVAVESDNAGTVTKTETVVVRTKTSIIETAIGSLASLKDRVQEDIEHKGKARSVTSKLDAALRSMKRARAEIQRRRNKQANNAIRTGINQLGALLNSLDRKKKSSGKKTIPPKLYTTLVNRTELLIEHLADARATEIEP